jgi:hypothetical protein
VRLSYGTALNQSLGTTTGKQWLAPVGGCIIRLTLTGGGGGAGVGPGRGGNASQLLGVTFWSDGTLPFVAWSGAGGASGGSGTGGGGGGGGSAGGSGGSAASARAPRRQAAPPARRAPLAAPTLFFFTCTSVCTSFFVAQPYVSHTFVHLRVRVDFYSVFSV